MSLAIPTAPIDTTDSAIRPVKGAGLLPGHRFLVQSAGEKRWTSPISHFTTPKTPQRVENCRAMPPAGTRIAWAGSFCLGEVRPDASFLAYEHIEFSGATVAQLDGAA